MTEARFDQITDRALGAYLGLALGDALGATVEFMTPREIAARYGVHRQIIGGGWLKLAAGQVTDDTTMSLALGEAILSRGGWHLRAVADAFVTWLRSGPVDCGNTCRRGIRRYMQDGSLVSPFNEGDAGNGALMRNLPVVLASLGNDNVLVQRTLEQCHLTHNHPLSDAATLAFARLCSALILGWPASECQAIVGRLYADHPQFSPSRTRGRATAFVVDTVQTVLSYALTATSFEDCLISTVNCGDDADTTGALAGMLAGARWGAAALPRPWLNRLDPRIRTAIEAQAPALLALAGMTTPTAQPDPHSPLTALAARVA